ncbi:preprotein translocase subunit SecY [Candidatus Peregrinibacteria bacterium]|jgi:preprotein translocase subunit SecY|nr:preprotein translocase subunit SecY [Candidatus Peregrinibacteria bacterium]MBT3599089.1 preprotein translocase subunit SecY [Candidatus Peregrinibacteria bacterium]MBT4367676.1 preprotein translocase subunit SecY [Candidatus Peregrinibacteria bacterium]MBT4585454.1 preprotein translocase subunit SecY [Candidatus Peregrinibacteria bacterium]MBT6730395.1 preprotein translocase subunit SecY [Candidatus Peregrinibacteria bacterium]
MFRYLRQLWHSEDLRKRILITLFLLFIYRLVAHITVPGTDPLALKDFLGTRGGVGAVGIFAALTGGAIDNFSVVMLGLSPYINASIIMQLSTVIFPKLEAISKEGAQGQQQINRYTRYLAIPLAFVQSYGFLMLLGSGGVDLVDLSFPGVLFPMLFVTTGSLFIMWLGELITEKGIGNGISLIIFTGIVSGIPAVLSSMFIAGEGKQAAFFLFCIVSLAMLVCIVLFTDAHRLIPITYANQGAGRGVQGNIPIRLNQAGMIPIIFSISLITLPAIMAQFLSTAPRFQMIVSFINQNINPQNPSILYMLIYFSLVMGFTYFYVSVTFKPDDIAESIQKRGGFIPGIRPGKPTAALLAKVSNRINLWGGVFLGTVAIVPLIFTKYSALSSQDLIISGSGLIIVVGVVMELIRQVNAQLLAHDYDKLV